MNKEKTDAICVGFFSGADDGNRTRVFGLGSGHSAIELHLRVFYCSINAMKKKGGRKNFFRFFVYRECQAEIFVQKRERDGLFCKFAL